MSVPVDPFGWLRRRIGRRHVRAADAMRDRGDWAGAAPAYERALRILPRRFDLAIQIGNCRKEVGDPDGAIAAYAAVPEGPYAIEATFQRGDALLRKGDTEGAYAAFATAARAGHSGAIAGLADLDARVGGSGARDIVLDELLPAFAAPLSTETLPARFAVVGESRAWLGLLEPGTPGEGDPPRTDPHVTFDRVGWLTVENAGRAEPLLAGIVAIRARILSDAPATAADLRLDGRSIAQAEPVPVGRTAAGRHLSAVNMWIDAGALAPCRGWLTLVVDAGSAGLSASSVVNVAPVPRAFDLAESDAFLPGTGTGDPVRDVLSRPVEVRDAARSLLSGPVREVLAMRVDQLGDLAASLPGLQRLRALFPDARITALVPPSLVAIVDATGLADSVLSLALSYDPATGRRSLDAAEEARARAMLAGRRFDLAIDLCPANETRTLLRLADARYMVGFNPARFPFLDFGIAVEARDKANRLGILSHAAHVSMLVEALAQAQQPARPVVKRAQDDTAALAGYGLSAGAYVVLHAGARHAINRWPITFYVELARRIADGGERVVLFTDPDIRAAAAEATTGHPEILLAGTMPDDHFAAILAHARLMIGNDSGPKHLAAVHGVETVGIHVNRLNWREWGQDGRGIVITRKVPCCGCALNDEALCARDVACLRTITVDDVHGALLGRNLVKAR